MKWADSVTQETETVLGVWPAAVWPVFAPILSRVFAGIRKEVGLVVGVGKDCLVR